MKVLEQNLEEEKNILLVLLLVVMKFELDNELWFDGLVVRITATVSFLPVFNLFKLLIDVAIGDKVTE